MPSLFYSHNWLDTHFAFQVHGVFGCVIKEYSTNDIYRSER